MSQQFARVRNLIVIVAAALATTGVTHAGFEQSAGPAV